MAQGMQPPSSPSQLAAQKYTEVQNYDELIAAGVGEPFPILTLLVSGEEPEEEILEIDFGRAAVAALARVQNCGHSCTRRLETFR